jgi:hypothetical protein
MDAVGIVNKETIAPMTAPASMAHVTRVPAEAWIRRPPVVGSLMDITPPEPSRLVSQPTTCG